MNAGQRPGAADASTLPSRADSEAQKDDVRARMLIALTWTAVVLPQVIQSLTTTKHQGSIEVAATALSPLANISRTLLTLTLAGTAIWLIVVSARRASRLRPLPLVVLVTPWIYVVIRDWYISGHPSKAALLIPLVTLAIWTLQPRTTSLSTLGYLTALAAFLSIVMAVIDPASAIYRSVQDEVITTDKQILPWGMLAGFLTQPNVLAKFLVLGIPATFLIERRSHRAAAVVLCLLAVVWTASRTSLEATVALFVIALVLKALPTWRSRKRAGAVAVVGAMATVCVIPFLPLAPTAFTNRKFIWEESLPYWHANVLFGQGSDLYDRIAKTSSAIAGAAFNAHNQFVQFLVTGGLCYVFTVAVLFWFTGIYACRLVRADSTFGVVYLVTLAGTFSLEITFPTVGDTLWLPVVLAPLAVIMFSRDNIRAALPEAGGPGPREPVAHRQSVRNRLATPHGAALPEPPVRVNY